MTSSAAPEPIPGDTVAVLLAAGGGTRFGGTGHKLVAELGGRPVVQHALDAVLGAGFEHVVVVTGAVPLPATTPIAPSSTRAPRTSLHVVHHERWSDGQATSLQVGLHEARRLGAQAVVVGLADQPFVRAEDWRAVAASPAVLAVATYDGVRSPPVKLSAEVWPLLPIEGDEGARAVMRLRPELVSEVPCSGNPGDVDTLEDLARWSSTTNSPSNDPSTKPGRS